MELASSLPMTIEALEGKGKARNITHLIKFLFSVSGNYALFNLFVELDMSSWAQV